VDEWGWFFETKQAGVIGEVKQPLFEDWDDLSPRPGPIKAWGQMQGWNRKDAFPQIYSTEFFIVNRRKK
jgi:hypothetical protein